MVTKKFSNYQKDLIKTCCNSNLPIVVVGKPKSGKENIVPLISKINPDKKFIQFSQLELYGKKSESDRLNDYVNNIISNKTGIDYSFTSTVFVLNNLSYNLTEVLGNFIKIDFFSKEGSEEVNLRVTDVTIDQHKVAVNLSDDVKNCLIYDETNKKFKFNNKGRTISLDEPGTNLLTGDVLINNLTILDKYIESEIKRIEFIYSTASFDIGEFISLTILDLRNTTFDVDNIVDYVEKLIIIQNRLFRKLIIMTDDISFFRQLYALNFNKCLTYVKSE